MVEARSDQRDAERDLNLARQRAFLESLGRSVRLARARMGWTQQQLANAAGLDRTYIGTLERGERNVGVSSLLAVAAALRTSLSALVAEAERLPSSR